MVRKKEGEEGLQEKEKHQAFTARYKILPVS